MSIILATTRFNETTLQEQRNYIHSHKLVGCIYGCPIRIKDHVHVKSDMFILEMNNTINKIVGIGFIKNYVYMDKYYKIYNDGNYNRYIYKGNIHIDRSHFEPSEMALIECLEYYLFYTPYHSKRGQGISEIPKWLKENKHNFDFSKAVKRMFIKRNLIKKPLLIV
jgi:hypothetical protein